MTGRRRSSCCGRICSRQRRTNKHGNSRMQRAVQELRRRTGTRPRGSRGRAPGRIVGLLGPNGSGKSTLIKLANGLLTPDAGEILIDGMAPSKGTKKIVSYLPERTYFADWMTALQLLDFFGDFYDDFDRAAAVQMMQRLGIQPEAADQADVQGHARKGAAHPRHEPQGKALSARRADRRRRPPRRATTFSAPSSPTTTPRPPSSSPRT